MQRAYSRAILFAVPDPRKLTRWIIRVSVHEDLRAERAAHAAGVSKSEFVRRATSAALEKEPAVADTGEVGRAQAIATASNRIPTGTPGPELAIRRLP